MTKWICKACKAINPIISGVCHNCGADYYELETVELRTNTKELSERIDREVERWMKIRAENKWLKEENLNSLKKLELMLADYTDCVDENKRLRAALDLALYYVEGDATYEGVKLKIEKILNGETDLTKESKK